MPTLNTQIKLRYDTDQNWASNSSVVLAKGEAGLVSVPETSETSVVMMKVGDGVTTFANLPWVYAKASDVQEWAKADTKPTYTHTEVGASAASHTHAMIDPEDSECLILGDVLI